jgi:hypothetical protein
MEPLEGPKREMESYMRGRICNCTAKTKCRKLETNIPRKGMCGLSPNFHIHVSVSDLYIPTIGPRTYN